MGCVQGQEGKGEQEGLARYPGERESEHEKSTLRPDGILYFERCYAFGGFPDRGPEDFRH